MSMHSSTRQLIAGSLVIALCVAVAAPAWAAPRRPAFESGLWELVMAWVLESPVGRWLQDDRSKIGSTWNPDDSVPLHPDDVERQTVSPNFGGVAP